MAKLALAQLPRRLRQRVLIHADSGGGTHEFAAWLAGRRLHYPIVVTITEDMQQATLPTRSGSGNLPTTLMDRPGQAPRSLS